MIIGLIQPKVAMRVPFSFRMLYITVRRNSHFRMSLYQP